ncbi:hypothetical protein [Pontiella agarivorans]|uniref:Uncharacterized protein n=1 Tax=Pontiella agarivorans TaxID=3038953 RepID=A0ABU5N0M7_9BACT|nr:hypothetical protein [Pontiella agarivorans]MDZ8119973.1 hypothetical protein [Pontiella agarivorans]
MISFSAAIFFDAFLHLGIYILAGLVLYYVLCKQADELFEIKHKKTVYVMSMVFVAHTSLVHFPWSPWPLTMLLLLALSIALVIAFFEVPLREAAVSAGILVIICMVGGASVSTIYSLIFPDSPTFSQYIGMDALFQEIKTEKRSIVEVEPGVEKVVSDTSLIQHNVFELFEGRIENLNAMLQSRKEKRATGQILKERMAVAMVRSGFAVRRDLLKAIQSADPQKTILLASFFAGAQSDKAAHKLVQKARQFLQKRTEYVDGFSLTEDQQVRLLCYIEYICSDGISSAIEEVRTDTIWRSEETAFYGSVLAGLIQAEYDIPMDRLVADPLTRAMMNPSSLKGMASSHWKRLGKNPQLEWEQALLESKPEIIVKADTPPKEEEVVNPYIRVTTSMGVVLVPDDAEATDAWIAAANRLAIRGFVSLDDEVVILSTTGDIVRKGQQWYIELQDFTYTFDITRIDRNRVYMKAGERIDNSVAVFN